MTNLFNEQSEKDYLSIFFDNENYHNNFKSLIDSKTYDSIDIVTFVSSPKFLFESIKEFKKVRIILGIEDNQNLNKYLLDPSSLNEFFESLDQEIIEKIINKDIEIRFTTIGNMIHSKIYNLKSTNSYISIVGSANFSSSALSGTKQFEELIGYTHSINPEFVNHYHDRFDHIYSHSIDFIPTRLKKKVQELEIKILKISEEESLEILSQNIDNLNAIVQIDEDVAKELNLEKSRLIQEDKDQQKELQTNQKIKKIFEIVTKQKKGITALVTPKEFEKKKETIITKVFRKELIKKEYEDTRLKLYYDQKFNYLQKLDESSNTTTVFHKQIDTDLLKSKIELLGEFISSYTNYTINNETNTQSRIFEAILYSFMAPFIWKIREEFSKIDNKDEIKTNIPLFLLIAGQAQSGKTHLIRFISSITGSSGNYFHYKSQAKLENMQQINPQVIDNFIHSENITPVFVDEINKEYFTTTNSSKNSYMGEGYIKNITNSKDGIHPCVIATSNTDFSANSQVMRRIYYIQLNNPFVSNASKTNDHFNDILLNFGSELYRDFIYKLELKFTHGVRLNLDDFIYMGREIFQEYFEQLNIKAPNWFSHKPINDYYTRGKEIWSAKYIQHNKYFTHVKNKNEILLDEEKVFGTKMSANRDKKELLQFLPIGVIIEDKGIVRLNREKFLEFIEYRDGWINKVFKW